MAKTPEKEKKENPLLIAILALFCAVVFFAISGSHDLELFFSFTIPGIIAFPILGVLLILISIFQFKEWFTLRKKGKETDERKSRK